jgi:dihydrofolate reductase
VRKLIISEFVTLDGVMEAPGAEGTHPHQAWVMDYLSPEQGQYKLEEALAADTLLIGRVTYETFAASWPERTGELADQMNTMQKVVMSSTVTDPAWQNTMVLAGDVGKGVTELKEKDGGPILVAGSARLVHTLLDHDLVDELRLMVFPVTIGAGLRLFPDTVRKTQWRRVDSQQFPPGPRVDTYQRA